MNQYTIVKNEYLSKDIKAFYRCVYQGYGKVGNPDYINYLKNTFNNAPRYKIEAAKNSVKSNLADELFNVLSTISDTEVAICVIPRSKAINTYSTLQLGFSESIKEVVPRIQGSGKNLIDGTGYIVRHTDTCTTHLSRSSKGGGGGSMPYIGITKDTCTISEKVKGKHILLIDDIYTKNINVDEDAIQCLLDQGAKDVTFFSIARTAHRSFYNGR